MLAGESKLKLDGSTATLKGYQGPQRLLETAERLFNAGENDVAVIVAQTACEVVAERAITKVFSTKGIAELEGPVTDYLVSYSIHGERNRKLYSALTGDKIGDEPFWSKYKKLADMRHEAVHCGVMCDKESTREGLEAAKRLVEHVTKHNRL
jgi:hypothetical protein